MSTFAYTAVDVRGLESRGTLDVSDQSEALKRIREMGLFPVRLRENQARTKPKAVFLPRAKTGLARFWRSRRVKSRSLAVFTRQLGTLIDAGMPLLRGLRLLAEQEQGRALKGVISEVAASIENGSSLAEALSSHPRTFDSLYVNMVRAGEVSGCLETTLLRLAEFREKAQRIKSRIKAAMLYPCAVLGVATAVLMLLMVYIVPRFQSILEGLMPGKPLPAFTLFVFKLSESLRHRFLLIIPAVAVAGVICVLLGRTVGGRRVFDRLKLAWPVIGPVFRKAAVARFSRTLGTLSGSGVPILQALNIVKETAGNVVVGRVVAELHENVKQGEPLAPTLRAAGVFPVMVSGMVDVGEQTGALPQLLLKVADTYEEEVDTAVNGMTSLLEPLMIVILAIIVGAIVVAIFLPLVNVDPSLPGAGQDA